VEEGLKSEIQQRSGVWEVEELLSHEHDSKKGEPRPEGRGTCERSEWINEERWSGSTLYREKGWMAPPWNNPPQGSLPLAAGPKGNPRAPSSSWAAGPLWAATWWTIRGALFLINLLIFNSIN
jgi:hypothetical protein